MDSPINRRAINIRAREGKTLDDRVNEWRTFYSRSDARLGFLLCDRHPAEQVAVTVLTSELKRMDYTYGQLRELSERFDGALTDLGAKPGDHVATLLGKGIEFVIATLAIWRMGAVHVPLFTAFAPAAIASRLSDSETVVVVTDAANRWKLDSSADIPSGNFKIVCVNATSNTDVDFWTAINGYRGDAECGWHWWGRFTVHFALHLWHNRAA